MLRVRHLTLRWPAILALAAIMPPLLGGGICVSADACGVEIGGCACIGLPAAPAHDGLAAATASDCGPCSDEAFNALRGGHAHASAPDRPAAQAQPVVSPSSCACRAHAAPGFDPPERTRILRC